MQISERGRSQTPTIDNLPAISGSRSNIVDGERCSGCLEAAIIGKGLSHKPLESTRSSFTHVLCGCRSLKCLPYHHSFHNIFYHWSRRLFLRPAVLRQFPCSVTQGWHFQSRR